jgi:hypothetical protein
MRNDDYQGSSSPCSKSVDMSRVGSYYAKNCIEAPTRLVLHRKILFVFKGHDYSQILVTTLTAQDFV